MKVAEDKISVIVPLWNADRYITRCVGSIINQTHKNLQIILINDGSTDDTDLICREYAIKDKRILYLRKENGGAASARNIGLDIADGDFIGFVDNDDMILPNMYEVLLSLLKEYKIDIARCSDYDNEIDNYENPIQIKKYSKNEFEELLITDTFGSHITDRLFRRSAIEKYRFPISTLEDMKFMRLILQSVNGEVVTTEKLYVYTNRPDNISNTLAKTYHNSYERAIEFKERYNYAMRNCPNVCDILLSKAVMQGAGSLRIMLKNRKILNNEINNIVSFFKNNSKIIYSNKLLPFKYKAFVLLLLISWKFKILNKMQL